MAHGVFCLMRSGLPLRHPIPDMLLDVARVMAARKEKKRSVQAHGFSGIVRTDFKHVSFGSISGTLFDAELTTIQGETVVRFVVRGADLAGPVMGFWSSWMPMGPDEPDPWEVQTD